METEPSFTELQEARRQSVERSLRPVAAEELEAHVAELFTDDLHPWLEMFRAFIREHREEQAYRGETFDGYGFVFYPRAHRGIWYFVEDGVRGIGFLSERNLRALADLLGTP